MLQDVRHAARGLRRSPGFTISVTLTLALGIGANAAMFGTVDRLMFRPFPYLRAPASMNRVYLQTAARGRVRTGAIFQYTRYRDLERWSSSFSQTAAVAEWRLAIGPSDAAREHQVEGVSASFFRFFDARPPLGRFFDASEDHVPRGADVAVLGYDYWRSELGGADDVIGRRLQVGPLLLTIVGVAPENFVGASEGESPAVFVPVTTLAYGLNQGNADRFATSYHWDWIGMIGRRKPGISETQASADLTNAFEQSRQAQRVEDPRWYTPPDVAHPRAIAGALRLAGGPGAGLEARTLLWVTGVAVIVLLIAVANVTNLMLARVIRRQREIAVRLALGVSRRRLAAQFVTEGLLLAMLGGIAGLVVSQWVAAALQRMLNTGSDAPGPAPITDGRTLAMTAAIAVIVGLVTAVGPAVFGPRGDLAASLRARSSDGSYRRSRARSALVVLQSALCVVLLAGAGLFVRSLENVRSQRLGWDPEPVLIATPEYRGLQLDSATRTAIRNRLLETTRSIPGVAAAARVNGLPFATSMFPLFVSGIDSVQRLGRFNYQATTPEYFDVVSTRIIRGRGFATADRGAAARVAVVSEAMARALWPGRDALGQCFRIEADTMPCTTVIGVAEDAAQNSIDDSERLLYYMPDEQPPPVRPGNRLFIRVTGGDAPATREAVRRALQRVLPAPAYVTVSSLADVVDRQRRSWRLGATMFAAFGLLALVVAGVGLYGVIAYDVTQRLHEIGVRVALGAQSREVVRLVVARAVAFAAIGMSTGLVVVLVSARWVQPLLFHESARDPVVLLGVGATLGVVALLASAAPAVRAARADPCLALRND
jgi:putative ABC transport system permease protein